VAGTRTSVQLISFSLMARGYIPPIYGLRERSNWTRETVTPNPSWPCPLGTPISRSAPTARVSGSSNAQSRRNLGGSRRRSKCEPDGADLEIGVPRGHGAIHPAFIPVGGPQDHVDSRPRLTLPVRPKGNLVVPFLLIPSFRISNLKNKKGTSGSTRPEAKRSSAQSIVFESKIDVGGCAAAGQALILTGWPVRQDW